MNRNWKISCSIGFHNWEGKNKRAKDSGELFWDKCKRCGKETDKSCVHNFGPFTINLN